MIVFLVGLFERQSYIKGANLVFVLLGTLGYFLNYDETFVGFVQILCYLAALMNISSVDKNLKFVSLFLPIIIIFSPIDLTDYSFLLTIVLLSLVLHKETSSLYMLLGFFLCVYFYGHIAFASLFIVLSYYLLLLKKDLSKELLIFLVVPLVSYIPDITQNYAFVISAFLMAMTYFAERTNWNSRYLMMSLFLYLFYDLKIFWVFIMIVAIEQVMFEVIHRLEKRELSCRGLLRPQFYHLSVIYFFLFMLAVDVALFIPLLIMYTLFALRAIFRTSNLELLSLKTYIISPVVLTIASGFYYNAEYSIFGFLKIVGTSLVSSTFEMFAVILIPITLFIFRKFIPQTIENLVLKYEIRGKRKISKIDLSRILNSFTTPIIESKKNVSVSRGLQNIMKNTDVFILYTICLVGCFLILKMVLL